MQIRLGGICCFMLAGLVGIPEYKLRAETNISSFKLKINDKVDLCCCRWFVPRSCIHSIPSHFSLIGNAANHVHACIFEVEWDRQTDRPTVRAAHLISQMRAPDQTRVVRFFPLPTKEKMLDMAFFSLVNTLLIFKYYRFVCSGDISYWLKIA